MPMKAGKIHGTLNAYINGVRRVVQSYENGKMDGSQKAFYEDGTIAQEAEYKNDKLHGEKKMYSKGGNMMRKESYKSGRKVKAEKVFYPSGDPMGPNGGGAVPRRPKAREACQVQPGGKKEGGTVFRNGSPERPKGGVQSKRPYQGPQLHQEAAPLVLKQLRWYWRSLKESFGGE
jgi:antitoxin component YwqK of YwqJK toxin-antitoxin module